MQKPNQLEVTEMLATAENGGLPAESRALAVRTIRELRMTFGTRMAHPDGVSTEELDARVNAAAERPEVASALQELAQASVRRAHAAVPPPASTPSSATSGGTVPAGSASEEGRAEAERRGSVPPENAASRAEKDDADARAGTPAPRADEPRSGDELGATAAL